MITGTYKVCPLFKHMPRQGGGSAPDQETGDGHIRIMLADNFPKIKRSYFNA